MAQDREQAFDLAELCKEAEVTPRTVRYYVQQGLLPAPGVGRGAKYGVGHLARLRLIRRLQLDHLPLAEIRARLSRLDDAQVLEALNAELHGEEAHERQGASGAGSSVSEYIAGVLGHPSPVSPRRADHSSPASERTHTATYERDRWDRYRLTDDVEVHVRRPLSREANRRIEKLLEVARQILGTASPGEHHDP